MSIRMLLFVVSLILIIAGEWDRPEAETKPVDPYACMTDLECEEVFGFPMDTDFPQDEPADS